MWLCKKAGKTAVVRLVHENGESYVEKVKELLKLRLRRLLPLPLHPRTLYRLYQTKHGFSVYERKLEEKPIEKHY